MYPDTFPLKKYLIWSRSRLFKKRLDRAKSWTNKALDMDLSWYVACSAGKDSVSLAHLVNSVSPGIPIWSEKDDLDFPGELEYLQGLADKYSWNIDIVMPAESLWGNLSANIENISDDVHSKDSRFSSQYFYPMIAQQEEKCDGVFLGLRAEESHGRRLNFLTRSHLYQRKNKKWTCNPLSSWTGLDVFAYLVSNEIPIFDVYFKTLFHKNDPARIRKAWVLPGSNSWQGQAAWLKYYYPEIFNKLAVLFPEATCYV